MLESVLPQLGWFPGVFPPNGLDRSLHAPVLVGLVVLTAFRETLGWSYSGLVVPGYLAAVFSVAPVTGALVVAESLAAYAWAACIGRYLPRTGAWSTLFGRERFLLLIISAIFVRLVAEAWLLAWLVSKYEFAHSRELYSIGLVLVPLLANAYWNAGARAAFPRIAVVTGLTYLFLDRVLLEYTNFTVSRFQVANENVSLAFLEAPHAYIILILGSVLAARDNIRYGWDYNGILVPALLAVSCYQPTKLVTTVLEALVILVASSLVVRLPPLSRLLIVGSRRMLICFGVGFLIKWVIGMVVFAKAPQVQMVDYFGFGYLLPSLLAVKMWNTGRVGSTLMPTLQVAVVSFIVGNGAGALMRYLDGASNAETAAAHVDRSERSVPVRLMLADSAPSPQLPPLGLGRTSPYQQALAVIDEAVSHGFAVGELSYRWEPPLTVLSHEADWLTFTPAVSDPDDDRIAPRVALNTLRDSGHSWLVVVEAGRVAAPVTVLSYQLAESLKARLFGLRSRLPAVRQYDDALYTTLAERFELERVLLVREAAVPRPRLSVVGEIPAGLSLRTLEKSLGSPVEVSWRAFSRTPGIYENASYLEVPRTVVEARAAETLGAPAIVEFAQPLESALLTRLDEITTVSASNFKAPSVEELRVFGREILPAFFDTKSGQQLPSAWQRALSALFGYRYARIGGGAAWALYEPASPKRRGNATFVVRAPQDKETTMPLAIEVPAPRWEAGAVDAALAVGRAEHARGFVFAGVMPSVDAEGASDSRRASGARSYYQHGHEVWMQRGGTVVAVHGISPTTPAAADAVLTFERETADPAGGPGWTRPFVRVLRDAGLSVASVDGSAATSPFEGSSNPAFAYAHQFGRGRMMLLWLSGEARSAFLQIRHDGATEQRIERLARDVDWLDTVELAAQDLDCLAAGGSSGGRCATSGDAAKCNSDALVGLLLHYNRVGNPYLLSRAFSDAECPLELTRERDSGALWVLVRGSGGGELVPLRTGPTRRAQRVLHSVRAIEGSVALGLATVRFGSAH